MFRAGCISGPNHSGAALHGFLSYLVKICVTKKYTIIGYKGKQVRDNIHSQDLQLFWEFYKNKTQNKGEVYNIGGGRKSIAQFWKRLSM